MLSEKRMDVWTWSHDSGIETDKSVIEKRKCWLEVEASWQEDPRAARGCCDIMLRGNKGEVIFLVAYKKFKLTHCERKKNKSQSINGFISQHTGPRVPW